MRGWRQWPDAALRTVEMVRLAAWAAVEHDALTVAQATAYSAMVALFPALIVAAAFVAWVPDTTPLRAQMAQFFDQVLPSNVTPLLETYFSPAHRSAHTVRALLGAVVVSATGASSVMLTLMEGFRRAYALPLAPRSFWPRRVRSLALVPVSLVPLAGASLLVVFGHFISQWLAGEVTPELRVPVLVVSSVMRWTIAFAGSVGIIAVIYHLGTDLTKHMREHLERKDWSWRASLPGAALATVLWLGSTLLFGLYVTRFADYSRVYGSLGAAIALMFWLYIIALSVLLGAEFNAQRAAQRDPSLSEFLKKLPGMLPRLHRGRAGRIAD
jgi:membrane protein